MHKCNSDDRGVWHTNVDLDCWYIIMHEYV